MCGLFAYIGRSSNLTKLRELATKAGQRGPHSCGWVWYDGLGGRYISRFIGSSAMNAGKVPASNLIIGHSRLATSGNYNALDEVQPLVEENFVLAHNGVVKINGGRIPRCTTANDSEILLRIMVESGGDLAWRVGGAFNRLADGTPCAMLATDGKSIAAVKRTLPLFVKEEKHGAYFCSVLFDGAVPLPHSDIYQRYYV